LVKIRIIHPDNFPFTFNPGISANVCPETRMKMKLHMELVEGVGM